MDKKATLNELLNADPSDTPFAYYEVNGQLRVLGKTQENGIETFFDRVYSRTDNGYSLKSEEFLYYPRCVTDAILEAFGGHNYLYFGSWRAKVAETREFFDRLRELKKQGAKELK